MKTAQLKRTEAQARKAARNKLTAKQQLAILANRPGEAKRERKRLLTLKPVKV